MQAGQLPVALNSEVHGTNKQAATVQTRVLNAHTLTTRARLPAPAGMTPAVALLGAGSVSSTSLPAASSLPSAPMGFHTRTRACSPWLYQGLCVKRMVTLEGPAVSLPRVTAAGRPALACGRRSKGSG